MRHAVKHGFPPARTNRAEATNGRFRQRELLLPGALLVTMGAQLLAPFVFVDFCFSPFFE
jgi:hypothetical protein